jgi:outer membrane protein
MKNAQRILTIVAVALAGPALTGCMPTRDETYEMLAGHRNEAFVRWSSDDVDAGGLRRLTDGLSLAQAVDMALGNDALPAGNTTLRGVREQRELARGQLMEARKFALPTVSATAGYTRSKYALSGGSGGGAVTVDGYSSALDLTQPLYEGGAIGAALRGARYFGLAADEQVRMQVQDTILAVKRTYYDVLLAEQLVAVQEEALDAMRKQQADVAIRVRVGTAIPYDDLRAQVEVSAVEADLIRQQNVLDIARTELYRLMGVSQRSDVKLSDSNAMAFESVKPEFRKWVETAFRDRPKLLMGELDLLSQKELLLTTRAEYLPSVNLWGRQGWDRFSDGDGDWESVWSAGLALNWTLFDGFGREGRIIQQRAVVRQAAIALMAAEQGILKEVKDAVLSLQRAEKLVLSQEKNVTRAREAQRLIQVGLKEGVNTTLEALDARTALTRAAGLRFQALHAHAVARLMLDRALGRLARSSEPTQDSLKNDTDGGEK